MKIAISRELMNLVLGYLSTKPYREVETIMQRIKDEHEIINPDDESTENDLKQIK